jgi:DNA-binding response OmpR family regulator
MSSDPSDCTYLSSELACTAKKILHVDDEDEWRTIVAAGLESAGYGVVSAHDGTDAMIKAETEKLGLMILDLNLAGENGVMLLKFLRRNHPGVPVLVYTGTGQNDPAIRSMLKEGADQHLQKGSIEELIITVGSYFK